MRWLGLLSLAVFVCAPLACSSNARKVGGTPGQAGSSGATGSAGSTASGQGGEATAGSASGAGGAAGDTSGAAGTIDAGAAGSDAGATGGAGGVAAGGAAGGPTGAGGTVDVDAGLPPGAPNMVPAGYAGTPFKTLTIPGFIYAADYDKGGSGVGFCHVGAASPPSPATCGGPKLDDWCCGTMKGCDERTQPAACPIYRADADNAGLSHMNTGEPDNYAASGPTWIEGLNGPTLTGPAEMAGTPVPQHANTTTEEDAYISYMYTGQWSQYTVQVLAAGTYAIGGLVAAPAGTTITFDFGNGVTSGTITVPTSPTDMCKCPETYHSWNVVSNIGTVTFPAAGTYLMKFTLVTQQFNPSYFTFSKM